MASISLGKSHEKAEDSNALPTPVSPISELPPPEIKGMDLPPPGSGEWKEVPLPPPPPGANRRKSRARGGR
jgi:hypothetical protein